MTDVIQSLIRSKVKRLAVVSVGIA